MTEEFARVKHAAEEAIRSKHRLIPAGQERMPYMDGAEVRVPLESPSRYWYWSGGQSLFVTLAELGASLESWRRYGLLEMDLITEGHSQRCKGKIIPGDGFMFCVECGRYYEKGTA